MLKNKSSLRSRVSLRATSLLVATQVILFSPINYLSAQESDSPQVMQTPDGKLYILTTDEQGNPKLQPLKPLDKAAKKSAPAAAPAPVTSPDSAEAAAETTSGNVQNFNFNEGSNVKIVPTPNGVEVEVAPLPETEASSEPPPPAPAKTEAPTKPEAAAEAEPPAETETNTLASLPPWRPADTSKGETLWSNGGFGFSLRAKEYKLESEAALQQGVHQYAPALGLHLEYNIPSSSLYIGTGFNFIRYEDEDPFFVRTYRGFGRFSIEESEARAGSGYLELGQRFGLFSDRVYIGLKVGYEEMAYSNRYIDLCRNCYEEDIEIDAGTYFGGGIGIRLFEFDGGQGLFLDVNYVEYTDDSNIENASSLQLSWVF